MQKNLVDKLQNRKDLLKVVSKIELAISTEDNVEKLLRILAEISQIPDFTFVETEFKKPKKVDVYMLGASLLDLLYVSIRHNNLLISKNLDFYIGVFELIKKMIAFLPQNRITPENAYKEYKAIVKKISVIPPSPEKPSPVRIKKSKPRPEKECPPGKVLNTVTNRCVKIKDTKKEKECPPGKVLNPATNRCIKIKDTTKTIKECPPGKVLNPTTNRCIKIKVLKECPPGKVRNPVTNRCKKV